MQSTKVCICYVYILFNSLCENVKLDLNLVALFFVLNILNNCECWIADTADLYVIGYYWTISTV